MKRKVVLHGPATLSISLPTAWVKQWKIKKGDELEVNAGGSRLVVSTHKIKDFGAVEADLAGFDRTSIILFLRNLYRRGYKEIFFRYSIPAAIHFRKDMKIAIPKILQEETDRLIGMEIIEQKKDSCKIVEVTEASSKSFDIIFRRAFYQTEASMELLIEALSKNDLKKLEEIEKLHDDLAKTVSFCLRLLSQGQSTKPEDSAQLYQILTSVDLMLDIMKYFSRDVIVNKRKFGKNALKILQELAILIKIFHTLNFDFTAKVMFEFQERRGLLKNRVQEVMKESSPELPYIMYMMSLTEIMRMVSETRFSMLELNREEK
jgi:phosphate uptake regulator